MSETTSSSDFTGPLAPPKLSLEQKLGVDLAWLLRNAPTADHTKAALRVANVCFPPDVVDLVAWVEENWNPPAPAAQAAPVRVPRPPRNSICITGSYSSVEYGTANYNQSVSGRVSACITVDELREMAENSTSREALMREVEKFLVDNGDFEGDDYGELHLGDTECEGEEDREIESYDFEEEIAAWLDENPDADPDYEETDSGPDEDDEEEEEENEEEEESN